MGGVSGQHRFRFLSTGCPVVTYYINRYILAVIVSFADAGTADVYNIRATKAARRVCPEKLWRVARRKLNQLNYVTTLEALRVPPGNQLELLVGDRAGQYSIRINQQYRICFIWSDSGPRGVKIVDYL
jgi:proteic killer suppression protein